MDGPQLPAPWFIRHAHLVTAGSRLLDVACGHGRHAKFFASRGALVTAVDRDKEALFSLHNSAVELPSSLPRITTDCLDLEGAHWPYLEASFDVVLVSNYLWRPQFDALLATIKPGGLLLYETFMDGNERYGKPSRPDFLLRSNELLMRTRNEFEVIAFEQGAEFERSAVAPEAQHTTSSLGAVVAVKQKICSRKLRF